MWKYYTLTSDETEPINFTKVMLSENKNAAINIKIHPNKWFFYTLSSPPNKKSGFVTKTTPIILKKALNILIGERASPRIILDVNWDQTEYVANII